MWSEQGTHKKNTHVVAFTSQNLYIPPLLSLFSSTIYLLVYIFFSFSHYILQFSFFFFLLLRSKFSFISFACCARARVFALKGRRVSVFFKICACNFSRRVCHYSKHTHSHPIYTHHMEKKNDGETHLKTIYICCHNWLHKVNLYCGYYRILKYERPTLQWLWCKIK